jgi:uncharacterized protein with NAD-binding domain and iron-sulfur cluster
MGSKLNMLEYFITHPLLFLYQVLQYVLAKLFSPTPPPPRVNLVRPKIAVIGAGLTGVSAASHIVGHGFDCRIFEAGPKENLGGIWSRVNNTSGLQIHSSMHICTAHVRQGLTPLQSCTAFILLYIGRKATPTAGKSCHKSNLSGISMDWKTRRSSTQKLSVFTRTQTAAG